MSLTALAGLCPYYTMFPLRFPLGILARQAIPGDAVLDPFCGRGTTSLAARLLGLPSVAIDANPVAVAITAAKLVHTDLQAILAEARTILRDRSTAAVPQGEFWQWAYHPSTLEPLCRLREALVADCRTPARLALRGLLLGALHGPLQQTQPSYLSNQCPRTYAPKPAYAVRFWQAYGLRPRAVDVLDLVARRARRFFATATPPAAPAHWRLADSRQACAAPAPPSGAGYRWVITSPPYYGMRTYATDQWLRGWFVGGPETVPYRFASHQLVHTNPAAYVRDLSLVWRNVAAVCAPGARLVVRYGSLPKHRTAPTTLLKASLAGTPWRIVTIVPAGDAAHGRRQADSFLRHRSVPVAEVDLWAQLRTEVSGAASVRRSTKPDTSRIGNRARE